MQIGKPLRTRTVERLEFPPLDNKHQRADFSFGVETLERHLQKQADRDISKRAVAVFVMAPNGATCFHAFQARNADNNHRSGYTRCVKKAVSIPDDGFRGAERLARKTKRSRSLFGPLTFISHSRIIIRL
jgi:hypothetical protein